MDPRELVEVGSEIVRQANTRGLNLRLMGGVAVYATCPGIAEHPKLQRDFSDIDLVADDNAWGALPELFASLGFIASAATPRKAAFIRGGLSIDVRSADFQDCFDFDLSRRLMPGQTTIPLVDLLLLKLQKRQFAEKDVQDSIALLLDHRVADGGDEETIDRVYLYELTNKNWGLWTTVFDNTVTLEKILDRYIDPEEAQLVWRRVELIQEVMDGKGKSLGWWLRAIPNRHIRWYREPADRPG